MGTKVGSAFGLKTITRGGQNVDARAGRGHTGNQLHRHSVLQPPKT